MAAPHFEVHPFLLGVDDVAKQLDTTLEKGLSDTQVQERQVVYGPNQLEVAKTVAWYSILIKQFCNAMIIVLFIILAVSFGVGDVIEGSVVGGVILINVSIGFFQESRAEKKMDALRSLSSPSATVIRNGHSQIIPNSEVVPGDVVMLRMGDTVPADVRLFECVNLSCDEQAMTGESLPVDKVVDNSVIDPATGQRAVSADNVTDGDRINLAFASTTVSKGRGRGIVFATGMATSVGRIADAAAGKGKRKPGRSMNARKYGVKQPFLGAGRRAGDLLLRLLGITDCTPLQRRLTYMSYTLFLCAVLITIIVFAVHRFQLSSEVVLYATSTGIAIIPESLAIVLIMSMVQAARVMRKANVVVRDLAALESLGGVTNICSDKTGTLTKGAMIVKKVWLPQEKGLYTVQGTTDPHDPTVGRVVRFDNKGDSGAAEEEVVVATADAGLRSLLISSALCNAATVRQDGESGEWLAIGDPTEISLQVLSMRFGMGKSSLEAEVGGSVGGWKKLAEFPFDSSIKRMSVIYARPPEGSQDGPNVAFVKGAVEDVIERCSAVFQDGSDAVAMTDETKARVMEQTGKFAPQGLRVLAVAQRSWTGPVEVAGRVGGEKGDDDVDVDVEVGEKSDEGEKKGGGKDDDKAAKETDLRGQVESGLTFLGLVGIYDPPREDTARSIGECTGAGIRVHMLTGDHPATAQAIASEVGILPADMAMMATAARTTAVMPATAFDALTDAQLDALPQLPLVVARCTPGTKTRMIEALRRRRRPSGGPRFTAMTGDGVNDAPSLRQADVGIAMGSGSDVAKSAAAIVLTDDRFSSIVAAVREGRRMFDNIQKFMLHLLASNVAEVILLVIGLSFRDAAGSSVFPVSALHILWINIFTSALPALGLGMEPAAPDLMRRRPHGRSIFTRQLVADMLVNGTAMGAVALLTFVTVVYGAHDGRLGHDCNHAWSPACRPVFRARATVFVQLTYLILFSAWEFTDNRRSLLHLAARLPSNRLLFWSVLGGMLPPIALVYIPAVGYKVMRHAPISWEWALVFAGLAIYFLACEAWKYTKRTRGWFEEAVVLEDGQFLALEDESTDRHRSTRSFSKNLKRIGTSFSRQSTMEVGGR